jgi:hypothetical protein
MTRLGRVSLGVSGLPGPVEAFFSEAARALTSLPYQRRGHRRRRLERMRT